MKLNQEIQRQIEALGWGVCVSEGLAVLQKQTFCKQNSEIKVRLGDSYDDLLRNIRQKRDNYDASYEAYLQLDETGHGKNGVPMIVVYNSAVACEAFLWDLWRIVKNWTEAQKALGNTLEYELEDLI